MRRAVLWDVDGTFVDSEPTHNRALMDALAAFGVWPSEAMQRRVVGASMDDAFAMLSTEHDSLTDLDAFIRAKLDAYLARASELALRRGVGDARRLLRRRALAFALVSNSDRIVVDANLSAVGLVEPGLVTIARNDVRLGKPDAEPYLRAAHLLDLAPGDCVVVEDSPVGARAGLAAGMTVVAWPEREGLAFPKGVILAPPDEVVSTLSRLTG